MGGSIERTERTSRAHHAPARRARDVCARDVRARTSDELLAFPDVSVALTRRNRHEKLKAWLAVLWDSLEVYDDLLSRPEESSSLSGFAPEPWLRGVCARCGGVGCEVDERSRLRYLEYEPELAKRRGARERTMRDVGRVYYRDIDPYREGVGVRTSWNGGALSKTVRDARARDASIARLERMERIRAGLEVPEDRDVRQVRIVGQRLRGFTSRLLGAVDSLPGHLRRALHAEDETALDALDALLPGRIPGPPPAYVRSGR